MLGCLQKSSDFELWRRLEMFLDGTLLDGLDDSIAVFDREVGRQMNVHDDSRDHLAPGINLSALRQLYPIGGKAALAAEPEDIVSGTCA